MTAVTVITMSRDELAHIVTALLPLELRAFNDDHPTLDEWRAAIDAAKGESS